MMKLYVALVFRLAILLLFAVGTIATCFAKSDLTTKQATQILEIYKISAADWPSVPSTVLDAFVAAEDRNFFKESVERSTITRDFASDFQGKGLRVGLFAVQDLGRVLGHKRVLDWYVNTVFLGRECYGVGDASQAYFGKSIHELTLHEAALLAVLPKAPAQFDPLTKPERALQRRNWLLSEMVKAGFLTKEEASLAGDAPLDARTPSTLCEGDDRS